LNKDVGADYVQKEQRVPKHGGFEELPTGSKCVSIDGDADRLVYFYDDATLKKTRLLDGDKIAALVATRIGEWLNECGETLRSELTVGVVQTAYANGASTRYIEDTLGLTTKCTATGVKHLHPAAEAFDVGVYFEANGHGTALFSDDALLKIKQCANDPNGSAESKHAAASLLALAETINPAVGDALSGVLVVESILRAKKWGLHDWDSIYEDLPSRQIKVRVFDRSVIVTADAERLAVAPEGMQAAIDVAVASFGKDQTRARLRGPAERRMSCASTPRGGLRTSPTRSRSRWRASCTRTRGGWGTNRRQP
jgi:phosphoacetylglucosamine mutase